jgi:SAM-dependent methyltransferase
VAAAISGMRPGRVLDVGCNNGHFSNLAVRNGAREVVAIDSDPLVVGQAWRTASAEGLNVLPLVVDLTRPTPAAGWRNRECRSFLARAQGSFDMVLMLAVLHHILVNERVPLEEILDLLAELTTDHAIVEFVAPEDSMFQSIVRGRGQLHAGLDAASFEVACSRNFRIVKSERLPDSHRWLYWLRRHAC